jgi:hypothetical protein
MIRGKCWAKMGRARVENATLVVLVSGNATLAVLVSRLSAIAACVTICDCEPRIQHGTGGRPFQRFVGSPAKVRPGVCRSSLGLDCDRKGTLTSVVPSGKVWVVPGPFLLPSARDPRRLKAVYGTSRPDRQETRWLRGKKKANFYILRWEGIRDNADLQDQCVSLLAALQSPA